MGPVHVEVDVSNPSTPEVSEKIRVLVDKGTMLSVLPASLLERLCIHRMDSQRFRSSGKVVTCDVGTVDMRYDGSSGGVTVAFGDDDDLPVMGLIALLTMGLEVDCEAGGLKHVEILML